MHKIYEHLSINQRVLNTFYVNLHKNNYSFNGCIKEHETIISQQL